MTKHTQMMLPWHLDEVIMQAYHDYSKMLESGHVEGSVRYNMNHLLHEIKGKDMYDPHVHKTALYHQNWIKEYRK